MKSYVKQVEAIQYQGDTEEILAFLKESNIEATIVSGETKVILHVKEDKWNVVEGDYIVKDFRGVLVYKASRFEEEFQEVFDECTASEELAEIKFTEVKPDLNDLKLKDSTKGVSDESQKALKPKEDQVKSKDIASTKPASKPAAKKE